MDTIDKKFIPTASIKRAIACLENRERLNRLIVSKTAVDDEMKELALEKAATDRAAIGDLRTLLDMSNTSVSGPCPPAGSTNKNQLSGG
jgi:hypothetical protein